MKKNILCLINGFGVQRPEAYGVYSESVMPNLDRLTKTCLFGSFQNEYYEYKSAYRNFSMGVDDPLTYSLIENNIFKVEYANNPLMLYLIQELNKKDQSKLHVFCYWDSEKTMDQFSAYIREIQNKTNNKIFVHIILCQQSLKSYKYIERGFNVCNYELGPKVKIGVVTGEDNLNGPGVKDFMKTFITEYGEKWKDLNKKIEVQLETRTIPSQVRTFAVSYGYGINDGDKILFFNYNNVNVNPVKKEIQEQKFRKLDSSTIEYYSLFPVKCEEQVPFMYNFAIASAYTLNSLKQINAKCMVFDVKERCPFINYYLTGLKNELEPNLRFMPTDDGLNYDANKLLENIKTQTDKDLFIINYDISDSATVEEIVDKLTRIDQVIGVLDAYVKENNYALIISSLYGMTKSLYNEKKELCNIDFSGKVPVIYDDASINGTKYSIGTGNLNDLANSILFNINPQYKDSGLLKKKSSLFSFLYKKPKENK